jgi:hypothetical protein
MKDGVIAMSKSQRRIYQLAMEVTRQKLSIQEFSLLIGKSYRQARRIVQKVRSKDALGVLHGNHGKVPCNKTPEASEQEVVRLLRTQYYDFNLTHFREMILEREGIRMGKNIIHRLARANDLVKRPKRRPRKIHKPRIRMPSEGMLIQFDGSEHNWFSDIICDLIVGIDDATSKIVGAEFFIGETSLHCLKVMKDVTLNYGTPDAYYLDEAGYFGKKDREQDRTQIGRALESLGSKVIIAGSAQAKGRVERLFNTLQDRLIAELRLAKITTIADANRFLTETFTLRFNNRFAVSARSAESRYRRPDPTANLDLVFCRKEQRKVSSAHSFTWKNQIYVIDRPLRDFRFRTININTHIDGSISYDILGLPINVKPYEVQRKNVIYPKAS